MEFVEAEIISTPNLAKAPEPAIVYTLPTAEIKNIEQISDFVKSIEDFFSDVEIDITDQDQVKQLRGVRADINKVALAIDTERKAMDKAVKGAIAEADSVLNNLRDRVKSVYVKTGEQIDQDTKMRKEKRRALLLEEYEGCAGVLTEVVTFEVILDQKWLNPSTRESSALNDLADKIASVARDYETLTNSALKHREACVKLFCETLDLSVAIALDQQLTQREQEAAEFAQRAAAVNEVAEIQPEKPNEPIIRWSLSGEFTGTKTKAEEVAAALKRLGISGGMKRLGGVS